MATDGNESLLDQQDSFADGHVEIRGGQAGRVAFSSSCSAALLGTQRADYLGTKVPRYQLRV